LALTADGEALNLQEYLQILKRRKWIIALIVILAVAASVGYCKLQKPTYTGTAALLLTPQLSSTISQATNSNLANTPTTVDVPTDTQVIESASVKKNASERVRSIPPVSVSQVGTTNVVNISVDSYSPEVASKAANAYVKAYLAVQQFQSVTALQDASKIVTSQIASVNAQIAQVDNLISGASASDLATFESQLPPLETELSTYNQELADYNFYATLNTGGGQLITPAKVPTSPSSPKPVEDAFIAGVIGILIGLGLALLLEYFDDRIRTKDNLEKIMGGVPTLGTIPIVPGWKDNKSTVLVAVSEPHSTAAEAYRSLRTAIQFIGMDRPTRLVQFTSPAASDGKTTTLANAAVALSQAGLRVVIVCCDLRRPRIHDFFGLRNDIGFTSVLLGDTPLAEALQEVPNCPGLHLLASGPKPPNPSELLASPSSRQLLESLADLTDIVLIDSPPMLPVTDPTVLARVVDAVVLVVSMGISTRSAVRASVESLASVNAPLVGVVLNQVPESDSYSYYKYAYTEGKPVNGKVEKVRVVS
jgi:capsular exopolysaccharide synthesis family protein